MSTRADIVEPVPRLASVLRDARMRAGLNQRELALRMGVSRATVAAASSSAWRSRCSGKTSARSHRSCSGSLGSTGSRSTPTREATRRVGGISGSCEPRTSVDSWSGERASPHARSDPDSKR